MPTTKPNDRLAAALDHSRWEDAAVKRVTASIGGAGVKRRNIDPSGMGVGTDNAVSPGAKSSPIIAFSVDVAAVAREMIARFDQLTETAQVDFDETQRRALIEDCARVATRTYLDEIDRAFHQWHLWTQELALCASAVASDDLKDAQPPLSPEERKQLDSFRGKSARARGVNKRKRSERIRAWLGPVIDASRMRAWLIAYGSEYLAKVATERVGVTSGRPAVNYRELKARVQDEAKALRGLSKRPKADAWEKVAAQEGLDPESLRRQCRPSRLRSRRR